MQTEYYKRKQQSNEFRKKHKIEGFEEYRVRRLTLEDGSTMLHRGGMASLEATWDKWPVVKAEITDELEMLYYIYESPQIDYDMDGNPIEIKAMG
jgi:hypothetical protein